MQITSRTSPSKTAELGNEVRLVEIAAVEGESCMFARLRLQPGKRMAESQDAGQKFRR